MSKIKARKRGYKASLIISAVVLFLLFGLVIIQILKLQRSGNNMLSHLRESNNMQELFYSLEDLENKLDEDQLTIRYLDSTIVKTKAIANELGDQNSQFLSFKNSFNQRFSHLDISKKIADSINSTALKSIITEAKERTRDLMRWHGTITYQNSGKFAEDNSYFPKLFIASTCIGFAILGISLYQRIKDNRHMKEKSSILDAILENTSDITNFQAPVYNDQNDIVDFKISYASQSNKLLIEKPPEDLIGTLISDNYPFLKTSDEFQEIVAAFENQTYFEIDKTYVIEDKLRYLKVRYIPVEFGMLAVVSDLTKLYGKQKALEKANLDLSFKNILFEEAEEVAQLGSYMWYTKDDVSIMSDNVYRILGFKPQSIPMSASKFREYTHPDDLELYDKVINEAHEKGIPIDFVSRIISQDKTVKYLYSKGEFANRNGKEVVIGVIQDITGRMENENKLIAQNFELQRRITELDSFNHVVSHDLQEPLRKIQMFISKIAEQEQESLTTNNIAYFKKIEKASVRMRKLIDNLLAFSRIDSKQYEFERVNLNTTLENVIETYSEEIEQSDISIEIDNLPKVHAIAFLMEQLFSNLIGNALKYKASGRAARIVIESSKTHNKRIPQDFIKTHAYYHVIKIRDNGIGFQQSESEKIFELFQRLHQNTDYKGTGLGLAICKKIVMKHHGYIYATSVPDKGSVFTVYLPSGKLKILHYK